MPVFWKALSAYLHLIYYYYIIYHQIYLLYTLQILYTCSSCFERMANVKFCYTNKMSFNLIELEKKLHITKATQCFVYMLVCKCVHLLCACLPSACMTVLMVLLLFAYERESIELYHSCMLTGIK